MPDEGSMRFPDREPTFADVVGGYADEKGNWIKSPDAEVELVEETKPVVREEGNVYYPGMWDDLVWAAMEIRKDDPDRKSKSDLRSEARKRLGENGVNVDEIALLPEEVTGAIDLLEHPHERVSHPEQWERAREDLRQLGVDVDRLVEDYEKRQTQEGQTTRAVEVVRPLDYEGILRSQISLELDEQNRPRYSTDKEVEAELRKRMGEREVGVARIGEEPEVNERVTDESVVEGKFVRIPEVTYYDGIRHDLETAREGYRNLRGEEAQEARAAVRQRLEKAGFDFDEDGRPIDPQDIEHMDWSEVQRRTEEQGREGGREEDGAEGETETAEEGQRTKEKEPVRSEVDDAQRDVEMIFARITNPRYRVRELNDLLKRYHSLDARTWIYEQIDQQESTKTEVGNIAEIQRQLEYVINPYNFGNDVRRQREAAQRWLSQFLGREGVTPEMEATVRAVMVEQPQEKITEVEIPDEGTRGKIEISFRMAMIEALEVKKINEPPSIQSFENFRTARARDYGYGKTHFPKDFEDEMEKEYNARAELARIMVYWDGSPDMEEGALKSMPVLSRSSYEWLAKEKGSGYLVIEGEEKRIENVESLRTQMNKVAGEIYARMVSGELDIWNKRGEDRLKIYVELASDPSIDVSVDAVRLAWQLAEAECWQARMKVHFVSHKAGKLVVFSDYRDFQSRKAKGVPGGMRRWMEYLDENRNVYPSEAKRSVYDAEGGRLARVGFEAWSMKVGGTDTVSDPRAEKFRKGQIYLFSEDGRQLDVPDELYDVVVIKGNYSLRVDNSEIERVIGEFVDRRKTDDKKDKSRKALDAVAKEALGGERALLAGQYFTKMEAFLAQPAITDIDLPQALVRSDLIKAANVMKTIEAFGEIDASKASLLGLEKLRDGLSSILFGFQSNDIRKRLNEEGKDNIRVVNVKGAVKQWEIGEQSQEKSAKARIRVGELTEEWAKSYVWLLSWENPAHESESKVVGMRDWILLGRDVATKYDSNHQWGEYIGYGCGNYNSNELAVESDGKTSRRGPTTETKNAAKRYRDWFNRAFYRNQSIIDKGQYAFTVTKARHDKDVSEYGEYTYGFLFWRKAWWNLKADDN